MSKIKTQSPIIHIPSFNEYKITATDLAQKYRDLGVEIPFQISDKYYYHTDAEGWAKLIPDLMIKSGLYKKDKFDCEDYAIKAQTTCAERYGLNTLRYTCGLTPLGLHGFNTLWAGERFLVFEPNEGFQYYLEDYVVLFEWEQNQYYPKEVLL